MTWISLRNPKPRAKPTSRHPAVWSRGTLVPFDASPPLHARPLRTILASRRSRRNFERLPDNQLGALFALACRASVTENSRRNGARLTRPFPSAGALYAIHIIVNAARDKSWFRYDPLAHRLVAVPSKVTSAQVRRDLGKVLEGKDATLLLFAAEPSMYFAKYTNACSLVWRDAGVLQGYLSIAAESLHLAFCLLGVTGDPWVQRLVRTPRLVGVGAAYVGCAT